MTRLKSQCPLLRKVVDNYLTGDFTPLEQTKKAVTNKSAYKPNECPFCNERGLVRFVDVRPVSYQVHNNT